MLFAGLEPTFLCYPVDEGAKSDGTLSRNDSLLNQCIDNDAHKCRIVYTSQYRSFAAEVSVSSFIFVGQEKVFDKKDCLVSC